MENEQMTTELQYQSKETERVLKANTKLTSENRALRRQMQLHEEARDLMATRTQGFQKLIAKLQARLRAYEQHEAAFMASQTALGNSAAATTASGGLSSLMQQHDNGIVTGGAEGRLKWMKELRTAAAMASTPTATASSMVPQSPLSTRSRPPMSSSGRTGASGGGGSGRHQKLSGRRGHRHGTSHGSGIGDEKGDSSDEGSEHGSATTTAATAGTTSSGNDPHRSNAMATAAARLSQSLGASATNAPSSSSSSDAAATVIVDLFTRAYLSHMSCHVMSWFALRPIGCCIKYS
jgi:hypothetical protein